MRALTSAWLLTFLWKLNGDIPSSDLLCPFDDLRFYVANLHVNNVIRFSLTAETNKISRARPVPDEKS